MASLYGVPAAVVESAREKFWAKAQEARDTRVIGPLQFMRARRVYRNWNKADPDGSGVTVGEVVVDEIARHAVASGMASNVEAIDWDNIPWQDILNFIMELISMIMKMFALSMLAAVALVFSAFGGVLLS